jgi:hypothetical protein
MTTKDPEYYYKTITNIEETLTHTTDDQYDVLNANYNILTTMSTELIGILKEYDMTDNLKNTSVQLHDDYKELYFTSYFTNISLLLGICLLVRYIIYYVNI